MPFHGSDDADPGSRATSGRPSSGGLMKGSAGGGRAAVRGLSLKRKLNLALGLLTVVILVLGAVSVRTLHGLTADGIPELGHHANLARVSEEIKTAVYRTMLAQSDYLLLGDQGAQDQVLRLMTRARERVEQLKPLAGQIESSAGTNVTTQHRALTEALDEFETRFTAQIKEIDVLRKALTEQDAALQGSERQLAGYLDAVITGARDLTAAAWPEQGTASPGQVALGRTLDRLTRELLTERVQLETFFASHSPALNDAARTSAAELAANSRPCGRMLPPPGWPRVWPTCARRWATTARNCVRSGPD